MRIRTLITSYCVYKTQTELHLFKLLLKKPFAGRNAIQDHKLILLAWFIIFVSEFNRMSKLFESFCSPFKVLLLNMKTEPTYPKK